MLLHQKILQIITFYFSFEKVKTAADILSFGLEPLPEKEGKWKNVVVEELNQSDNHTFISTSLVTEEILKILLKMILSVLLIKY